MRDVNRIKRILNLLEDEWQKNPDWRFGQLLYNIEYLKTPDHAQFSSLVYDPFYVEDERLIDILTERTER